MAGDPSTSRSGAGRSWVTGHMLAAQPSWVRGRPTTFSETASILECAYVVDTKIDCGAEVEDLTGTQLTAIPSRHW